MLTRLTFQALHTEDLDALQELRRRAILATPNGLYDQQQLTSWARPVPVDRYRELLASRCLWGLWNQRQLVAAGALELCSQSIVSVFVDPDWQRRGLASRMVAHLERLACRYGLTRLLVEAALPSVALYRHLGYRNPMDEIKLCYGFELPCRRMHKSLHRRRGDYQRRIIQVMDDLAVPSDYPLRHRLPMQTEARQLTSIGDDMYQRPQRLTPGAAKAWGRMHQAARADGIELQVVSAFRSVDYQCGIIRRKLEQGQSAAQIYQVSAAPGFSEHHTGRALDLSTPGAAVLETEFAATDAYAWLRQHAQRYGFSESYPRDNPHRLAWEPWHWAWREPLRYCLIHPPGHHATACDNAG
ncbi:MAG: hypothetical protein Tsb002_15250 [Wenzhouxiangellaceae bacterium]